MRLVVQKVVLLPSLSFYMGWEEVTGHIAWSISSRLTCHTATYVCDEIFHVMIDQG